MASFWLSKRTLIEALKLSEGEPHTTMVCFDGKSELKNGIEYTIVTNNINGKKKTVRENFNKLSLANNLV